MIKEFIEKSWLVIIAALVFGLLISAINGQLKPIIETKAKEKLNEKLAVMFGAGVETAPTTAEFMTWDNKKVVVDYFTAKKDDGLIGYALIISGSGFADKIELLVGFDVELKNLKGIAVLKSNETPGFGDKIKDESKGNWISFKDCFKGRSLGSKLEVVKSPESTRSAHKDDNQIVSISGSTISSESVTKIVNQATKLMRKALDK
ncbi:MAG: FMN-binding protein [Phycisphaerae bacterium]|nr:FMN-binding protein [Phycisphaerae bacterium]